MIKLLVGLGQPRAPNTKATRHNAGFWWIDEVARRWKANAGEPNAAYHGLVARVNHPSGPVWLLEPQTYMNPLRQVGGGAGALLQDRPRGQSWSRTMSSTCLRAT